MEKLTVWLAECQENDDEADGDDGDDEVAYLAALAGVHAIMEARCLVPTNSTQHAVVPVEFWK